MVQIISPPSVTVTNGQNAVGSTATDIGNDETVTGRFQLSHADGSQLSDTILFDQVGGTVSGANFGSNYWTFTIDSLGDSMNLESLTLSSVRATTSGSTRGYEIFAETDGDAFAFGTSTLVFDIDEPNNRNDGLNFHTIDLSAAEFQNIDSISFRIYGTGGGVETLEHRSQWHDLLGSRAEHDGLAWPRFGWPDGSSTTQSDCCRFGHFRIGASQRVKHGLRRPDRRRRFRQWVWCL